MGYRLVQPSLVLMREPKQPLKLFLLNFDKFWVGDTVDLLMRSGKNADQ